MRVLDHRDPQPLSAEAPDRPLDREGLPHSARPGHLEDTGAGHVAPIAREYSRPLLPLAAARAILDAIRLPPLTAERVPFDRALGRLSADTVRARLAVPPRPTSAMDGYAVRLPARPSSGPFEVRGTALLLTRTRSEALRPGEAVYVTTGAFLPPGANAVVRVESTRRERDRVYLAHPARRHQDVVPAGESVGAGEVLLRRGEPIGAAQLGALLAQRIARVRVLRLRATVLPIGDELVAAGKPPGRRRWDFMGPTLAASLPFAQVTVARPLPDDRAAVGRALRAAARRSDLLVTIGGSSVGPRDVTKAAVREVGELWFEGVRVNVLKRGAAGRVGRVPVVVLPGQLVSAVTVFHEHGLHLASRMVGRELRRYETAVLAEDLGVDHRLDSAYLFAVSDGKALPLPWGVARMTALLRADGFAVLHRARRYRAGEAITVQRHWAID